MQFKLFKFSNIFYKQKYLSQIYLIFVIKILKYLNYINLFNYIIFNLHFIDTQCLLFISQNRFISIFIIESFEIFFKKLNFYFFLIFFFVLNYRKYFFLNKKTIQYFYIT
jgi:hypothetical protein